MKVKSYGAFVAHDGIDGVRYFTGPDGDFYDLQAHDLRIMEGAAGDLYFADAFYVVTDPAGVVLEASDDVSHLSPEGHLWGCDEVVADPSILEIPWEWRCVDGGLSRDPGDRVELVAAARKDVDGVHASFLRRFTGDSFSEERDTWKVKEETARRALDGVASASDLALLQPEAAALGISIADLAVIVIGRAEEFMALVGMAAALRAKGKLAIAAAAQVPDAELRAALRAALDQFADDERDAIAAAVAATSA